MAPSVRRAPQFLPSDWVKQFVDEIPCGTAVFDRELRYVAANSRWIDAFQLTAATLSGRRHDEVGVASSAALAELQRRALSGDSAEGFVDIELDDEALRYPR